MSQTFSDLDDMSDGLVEGIWIAAVRRCSNTMPEQMGLRLVGLTEGGREREKKGWDGMGWDER